jgi:Mce-associated membrane protein
MSFLRGPAGRAAWIAAALAAVVAAALAVVLFVVVYPARSDHSSSAGTRALSADEQAAMKAASVQMVNLLSYTRPDFDADFARALAGTTGQLHDDLAKDKDNTLAQLKASKFDTKGTVSDVAVESGTPAKGLLVLVVAEGFKIDDKGQSSVGLPQRVELTMVRKDGKWLATDLKGLNLV